MTLPSLAVVVVTYERPAFLMRCLRSLHVEGHDISEIVVVDASEVSAEAQLGQLVLEIRYFHAPELAGWMTRSRNRALLDVTSDVVAFLDDDVVVREGWAHSLRETYASTGVDAVAGRTCNGLPGEDSYDQPIGRLLPDGRLTEGFAAAVDEIQRIDHGIGANMSFTRDVLHTLGGFRDDYPGTALREDTDMFLRVQRLGRKAVFSPSAVVDHRPAPHIRGRRFDTRYKLYGRRNHMVLLARHAGATSPLLRRWVKGQFSDVSHAGSARRRLERLGVVALGVGFGTGALLRECRWGPLDPIRSGESADDVRRALSVAARPSRTGEV